MSTLSSSQRQRQPKPGSKRGRSDEEKVSFIARDLHVEGTLRSSGAIRIEGTVTGAIHADHQVLVATGGSVEGDIHAPEVILGGEVNGLIFADGRVEVQVDAVINGNIKTPRLEVAEGALVFGPVDMAKATGTLST